MSVLSKKTNQTNTKIDRTNLWPVFGRSANIGTQNVCETFWLKDKKQINNDYEISIQGKLNRVGKKNKLVKIYFYYIQGTYLYYKEKCTDKYIKGYIKLQPNIKVERKVFQGKKEVNFLFIWGYFLLDIRKNILGKIIF